MDQQAFGVFVAFVFTPLLLAVLWVVEDRRRRRR